MTYLITCSGSKIKPVENNSSNIEKLSFGNSLLEARNNIIQMSKVDLDWSKTMPAWKLYSGNRSKIYPQISAHNWEKSSTDIYILSALFGWIKHTDLIPFYDLQMSDKIGEPAIETWRIWYNTNILSKLINNTAIDLLSNVYRKAINGSIRPFGKLPEAHFTDRGVQKGRWLNSQLNKV